MINEDQIRTMILFMERNGDLRRSGGVNRQLRMKKKWLELVAILNKIGDKKTLRQWSKVWSDAKYNTLKKYKRSLVGGPELTGNDKAIIELIQRYPRHCTKTFATDDDRNTSLEITNSTLNNTCNTCESPVKEEMKRDHDMSNQEQPRTEEVFCVLPSPEQRRDSVFSSASSSKSSTEDRTRESRDQRRSSTDSINKLSEIADKFYELERERERLAHEREMARIQQHSEFLSVMSRLVNVVESLAPSIKMYLDRNLNGV